MSAATEFIGRTTSRTVGRERGRRLGSRKSPLLALVSILVYAFLYLPLIVIVLYSFSAAKVNVWPIEGYTLDWYRELRHDRDIVEGIKLSVRVGLIASAIAVVLGTLAGLAIDRYDFRGKAALRFLIVLPITLPGIVTGVALLSYFTLIHWELSNWTIIVAHATFCVTLVMNNVIGRLSQLPRDLEEASADLGASPVQTFRRITLPLILPAVVAGALLAFTLSFDEIVVTLFLKGRDNTLPLVIWGRLRRGLSPEVNAAATVIIAVSFVLVIASSLLAGRSSAKS
ncbi:MAG: spermidine/putrescine transport system permease protein [Thermomicrobiales bacterium]|jgi:spermidine/putrescine transport system permease protein|nr:spermidine/putrescine transport system permease protein [Thermomicrobiales bacterium]